MIVQSGDAKNKFKATLKNVLVPPNVKSYFSASNLEWGVNSVSSTLFRIVEASHRRSDQRHINGIKVSRNAAKQLLG